MESSLFSHDGEDCRDVFKAVYENRYTWDPGFKGYKGSCLRDLDGKSEEGTFLVGEDLKASVEGVIDEDVKNSIASQLWEVCIHRVRRSFEQVHGQNTFITGSNDSIGLEVIVGGKNIGDRYKIKNGQVTMVKRHIHGTLVQIFTQSTIDTGLGYLSKEYTSQYLDPISEEPKTGKNYFNDSFVKLDVDGPWVLNQRVIKTDGFKSNSSKSQIFKFFDMTML